MKRVFFFGGGVSEGAGLGKERLGGKGAGLAEMTALEIPVPPGFTIEASVCTEYQRSGLDGIRPEAEQALARLEKTTGKRFGDSKDPLLVSVRSGARSSMPGMMDTVLNLGLTPEAMEALARLSGERFALDCRRRFLQMYSDIVLGIPKHNFEEALEKKRHQVGAKSDAELSAGDLREVVREYEAIVRRRSGKPFPDDPQEQLWGAIGAVFRSWDNERAKTYRRLHRIPGDWGTAVNVQAMVFGNRGETSATGVAFTRNPSTGEKGLWGEFLPNAQGEDVVAGIRTPRPLSADGSGTSLEETMPQAYAGLRHVRDQLERKFRDMQDLEFTIENGKLYLLQTRNGKRTGFAAVRIATDMVGEGLISEEEAVSRVEPEQLVQLLAPVFPEKEKGEAVASGKLLGKGLPAGPGAASGRIAFTAERAVEMAKSGPVVLVREETSPEDIAGMHAAVGILTTRGGMSSHAAVVARGMGKTCVVGAGEITVARDGSGLRARDLKASEGDWISIDGTSAEVILGKLPTRPSEILQVLLEETLPAEKSPLFQSFTKLLSWADGHRRLGIRTNADTPGDARTAVRFGAEGIGLCRTEHMFFEERRILAVREMILSESPELRRAALSKILPMQREDFVGIFREMGERPVTIRLLDPPLHEFLPNDERAIAGVAAELKVPAEKVRERVQALHEANPMLGHRGCRLGITHPEIYEMQVRAIFEAAAESIRRGGKPQPEIMIPLIGTRAEFEVLRRLVDETAVKVVAETGQAVSYRVGTMIEIPRAALQAEKIAAANCEFFSFGTNDLTQMAYGYSRDDAGSFLAAYVEKGILPEDPFASLDREGVGELVAIGTERGRRANPNLKVGICGEHGGDPSSIEFFHQVGLDYVSCSPFRVPVARLAAARAALAEKDVAVSSTA
jgi:pyruvate,orthophosphate dikinase